MHTLIVDADPIVYRAGFTSEHIEYHVILESWTGELESVICQDTEELSARMQLRALEAERRDDIVDVHRVPNPEPVENAYHSAKVCLKDCIYATLEKFDLDFDDLKVRIALSGPGNFREWVAQTVPYKGNRDQPKPHWYQQIRNYLTDHWHAEVITGREADDECSILANSVEGSPHVVTIASIDKDLLQIPGWHYNYHKKTFEYVTKKQGKRFFWQQVLQGDNTDNIPGCFRVGPVKALEVVDSVSAVAELDSPEMWKAVLQAYEESLDKYGDKCPYYARAQEVGIEEVAIEMARLVHMQEYAGQLWTPPGRPDELLTEEFEE